MNVGERLDETAVGLANALALARHRGPAGVDEQITVAVARTRLYQGLHRQLTLIAGPDRQHWDPHVAQLSRTLRGLTTHADSAMPSGLPTVPARGPVGTALHRAADWLAGANNVLEAHLGDRRTPRSPEGVALAARLGAPDNLAAVGRLALAAFGLDERLLAGPWLDPSPSAGPRRDLLLAVNRDVRGEWLADGTPTAEEVARAGAEDRGFVRDLDPLPPIFTPELWRTVTSARHALAAADAARIHLFNHGGRITAPEISAVARASSDIVVKLTDVMALTGTPAKKLALLREKTESQWASVARSAANLRVDVDPRSPVPPVASTALRAVAAWLETRLRTETDLSSDRSQTAGTERRTAAWRHVVGRIAVRVCDVGEQLRSAVETAQAGSRIYRMAGPVSTSNREVQTGGWLVTSAAGPPLSTLSRALLEAQKPPATLAAMAGVPTLPGTRAVQIIQAKQRRKRLTTEQRAPMSAADASPASQPTGSQAIRAAVSTPAQPSFRPPGSGPGGQ